MAVNSVALTDSEDGTWIDQLDQKFGPFQVIKSTLRCGPLSGIDIIDVVRDRFRCRIIPTRGMGLAEVHLDSNRFGWNSPICGPVHPSLVPNLEPSGLGWLEGFDELLVRCGLKSNGAPAFDESGKLLYPLHGRIANLPASKVQLDYDPENETLEVSGTVVESRFHFDKLRLATKYRFESSSSRIQVSDEVTNFGGTPNDFQMLYHFNLGPQLLEPGGQIFIPSTEVVPRDVSSAENVSTWDQVHPPQPGSTESAFFFQPKANPAGGSLALLTNAARNLAAGIRYSPETLPCFTLWKNFVAEQDGYVIGLEPGTNYPNTRPFEEQHDRVVQLAPGQTKSIDFELVFATSPENVVSLIDESNAVQANEPPEVSENPRPDWCE